MPTMHVQMAAEAICGALYRFEFTYLGDTEGGKITWFTRGDKPKIIRVRVQRSEIAPVVLVGVDFPNVSIPGEVKVGQITMQVDTRGTEPEVVHACENAVRRILEIFRDVLEGTGVAGREAATPKYDPGDEESAPEFRE